MLFARRRPCSSSQCSSSQWSATNLSATAVALADVGCMLFTRRRPCSSSQWSATNFPATAVALADVGCILFARRRPCAPGQWSATNFPAAAVALADVGCAHVPKRSHVIFTTACPQLRLAKALQHHAEIKAGEIRLCARSSASLLHHLLTHAPQLASERGRHPACSLRLAKIANAVPVRSLRQWRTPFTEIAKV